MKGLLTIAFPNRGYVSGRGRLTTHDQPKPTVPTILQRQAARPAAYREHYDVPSRPRSAPADQDVAGDWARMHCLQGTLNRFLVVITHVSQCVLIDFWTRSQKVFHCFVQKVCAPECWSLVAICQRDEQLMSSCIMQPSIPMVALIIWCKKRLAFSMMPFQTILNTHDRELLWQSNFGWFSKRLAIRALHWLLTWMVLRWRVSH